MDYILSNKLGSVYTLDRAISEVQVLSGQLDPESVPKHSIAEHISLSIYEIASLLNNLNAPWYGVILPITLPARTAKTYGTVYEFTIKPEVSGTLPLGVTLVNWNENSIQLPQIYIPTVSLQNQPGIERIVAVVHGLPTQDIEVTGDYIGTVKRARDISQFWGIARGGNSQWQKSIVWLHHGNRLLVWIGGEIILSTTNNILSVFAYRLPAPLDLTNDNDVMDIPDKYASLVFAKAAKLCLKQANMGEIQEVDDKINEGIAQLTAEYEKSLAYSMQKSKMENIEQ